MTRLGRFLAYTVTSAGCALALAGLHDIYPPAALIAAGAGLVLIGLFVFDVKP